MRSGLSKRAFSSVVAGCMLALFAAPAAHAGQATFAPVVNYPTGSSQFDVELADFNNDGILDSASAGNDVTLLIGVGDGTFGPAQAISAGRFGTYALDSGDLNSDGNADLAVIVSQSLDSVVSVLLGNGNGSFADPILYPSGVAPTDIAVADLNADGILDLALSVQDSSHAAVFLGRGDGTFGPRMEFPSGGSGAWAIAVGLFDGDAVPDIAIANALSRSVSILQGEGDGTFRFPPINYAVGTLPVGLSSADVRKDGLTDLIVANFSSGTISLLEGESDGTFANAVTVGTYPKAEGLAVADYDGDGHADIATTNGSSSGGGVGVFAGHGDGTFDPASSHAAGTGTTAVAASDLNADARIDLAATNFNSQDVSILLNTTDQTPPSVSVVATTGPDGANGWYINAPTFHVTGTDESGIESCDPDFVYAGPDGAGLTASGSCRDNAGNIGTGSSSPFNLDRVGPSISCPDPAPVFTIGGTGQLTATASDATSGPSSQTITTPVDTSTAGSFTVAVSASDLAGNTTTGSCAYVVRYDTVLLYDTTRPAQPGSTVVIKLRVVDADGTNLSSQDLVLTVAGITPDPSPGRPPSGTFTFSRNEGGLLPLIGPAPSEPGYHLGVKTTGYPGGRTYTVLFRIGNDPTLHEASFVLS